MNVFVEIVDCGDHSRFAGRRTAPGAEDGAPPHSFW
jgi:hypothetical protein